MLGNVVTGDACPICAGPSDVILDLDASFVTAGPTAPLPGYVCVVARAHVVEPFELDGLHRRRYFEEVCHVAARLRGHTGAKKIDYEIHGNTIPHLHTHLYPRFDGDPFSGRPVDSDAALFERTRADLDDLAEALARPADGPRAQQSEGPGPRVLEVYDGMASWYAPHSEGSFFNANYDRPAVLETIGDVAGQRVLDLGCGPGYYLAALRERGADVVGVDGSTEMLAGARRRTGGDIRLVRHDLNEPLTMLEDGSFDGVVSALAYHHVDNRRQLLSEVWRVLRPGGWLVLSTTHPTADWLKGGGSYFAVERTEVVFDTTGTPWRVPSWRMPIGALLDEVLGAGLSIERVIEPVPPPTAKHLDDRLYDRLTKEPAFLVVRARRPRG